MLLPVDLLFIRIVADTGAANYDAEVRLVPWL